MIKRLLLGLTFVSAFTFAGFAVTDEAEAWRRWGRSYRAYYGAPRSYYYESYRPYRTYYGPRTYYRSYYRPYYGDYYYGGPGYYYGPRSGVSVSFGF